MPQNPIPVQISVVIPTCDRKVALLSLLDDLDKSDLPLLEIIIVDSGNDPLVPADYAAFGTLDILCMGSERSVCIQRNAGIAKARAAWIFLCDDDVEMPPDYLRKLSVHIHAHPEAGAVCGLFLQKEGNEWKGSYPVDSAGLLLWKWLFSLGFWGEIRCGDGGITRRIRNYYLDKGNHISRSGWPVLVDFSGPFFITPVYTLGAALVKKDWLLQAPLTNYSTGMASGIITECASASRRKAFMCSRMLLSIITRPRSTVCKDRYNISGECWLSIISDRQKPHWGRSKDPGCSGR